MKKICIVTTMPGTLKSFVLPTAQRLHEKCGYDITLISSYDESFEKSLPEYIHYIPVNMKRGVSISGFGAISKLRKIFKEQKFDLVQYSTPNASFYASIASKQAKAPIRLYAQWGIRYVGLSGVSRKIFKALEKASCKNSTHVRSVSPMNMEFGVSEGLYKREKVKVLGRGGTIGVNTLEYDISKKSEWRKAIREQYGIQENEFLYGFVGRFSTDKGCKELLLAFKEILQEKPDARLIIIGANEAKSESLMELVEWAKSCKNIIMTGRIEKHRMKEYFSALDLLVHPTYREGFGMVIQEAGALAVPVITTRIPGASEVMIENESCMLVDSKNKDQLKEAMLQLINDDEKRASLGNGAYKMVCNYYDRERMLDNLQADYEELLK